MNTNKKKRSILLFLIVFIGMSVLVYTPYIKAQEEKELVLDINQTYDEKNNESEVRIQVKEKREGIEVTSISFHNEKKEGEDVSFQISKNGEYQIKVTYLEKEEEKEYTENCVIDSIKDISKETKEETIEDKGEEKEAEKEGKQKSVQPFGNIQESKGISISTNKDSGFVWWEDTQAVTSTIKVAKDISLPAGSERVVTLQADSEGILSVASLSSVDGTFITNAQRLDDNTVQYTINNDSIPNDGINITTSYSNKVSFNTGIGIRLLRKAKAEGTSDWGFNFTASIEGEEVAKHKIDLVSELAKLNEADEPLINGVKIVNSNGVEMPGYTIQDLKISTEGNVYVGEIPYSYSGLKLELNEKERLPIGNLKVTFPIPEGFELGNTYVKNEDGEYQGQLRYANDYSYEGKLDAGQSGNLTTDQTPNNVTTMYYAFSTSLGANGSYFVDVAAKANQFIGFSGFTTSENSSIYTNKLIHELDQEKYEAKNESKITYEQIKLLGNGSYTIEEKEYDLGKIVINNDKDSYKKVKVLKFQIQEIEKVSEEDSSKVYKGYIQNTTTSAQVNSNEYAQYHLGGTITYDIPEEFEITGIQFPRSYNSNRQILESITYELDDGTQKTVEESGTSAFKVEFEIPEGRKVVKVIGQLNSTQGFGKQYRQAINLTEFYGTFYKPSTGDKIAINVRVESENDETESGKYEWTYEDHPDNGNFKINTWDTHLGSTTSSDKTGYQVELMMTGGWSQPSKKYTNAKITISGGSSLETKTIHPKFEVCESKVIYEGDGYIVYTTNQRSEERRIQIVKDGKVIKANYIKVKKEKRK